LCDSILDLLHANPGDCDVTLEALTEKGMLVRIKASEQLRVTRTAELEEALKKLGLGVRIETNGTHARV
jgi:hypothetical protein